MRPLVGVGCAVFLITTIARTPPAGADPLADLAQGIRAYQLGELQRALPLLRRAAGAKLAAPARGRAWLYLGLSHALRRDLVAARRAFEKALRLHPAVSPDRDRVGPATLALFDSVARMLVTKLRFVASESGARVFVDGKEMGRTPCTVPVLRGAHDLRVLSSDGSRRYVSKLIAAKPGALVRVTLRPVLGRVLVDAAAGTQVLEGDRLLATLAPPSESGIALPVGRHRLTFRRGLHVTQTREVVVAADSAVRLRVELERAWWARRRTWGWTAIGVSGASLIAGLLAGRSARASEEAIRTGARDETLTVERYRVLASGASADARAANVLFAISGATALTGVILLLTGGQARDSPRTGWRLQVGPTRVGVVARF